MSASNRKLKQQLTRALAAPPQSVGRALGLW